MALIPDPIFYARLVRGEGARRTSIHVWNDGDEDIAARVASVEKPDWLDVEGLHDGCELVFRRRSKREFIVNVDTNHTFLPADRSLDERFSVEFDGDDVDVLDISITIQEIIDREEQFHGVFALDFGTTNSCYAFKDTHDPNQDPEELYRPAKGSVEIPSAIYFTDVHNRERPRYSIGVEALHQIRDHSHDVYGYFLSIKRMLGSGRKFFVMDRQAGLHPEHRQEWTAGNVSAFVIRELIRKAEKELDGRRISQVIATFPTLFSDKRKQALREAVEQALEGNGVKIEPDSVILDLDEANACAFNYIYGPLLDDFRNFGSQEKSTHLLSYDFGGGTIDISLMRVRIAQDDAGRIDIETSLEGVSGDACYGGDNVTLEMFRMLKPRLALLVADQRLRQAEEEAQRDSDPFATASGTAKDAEPEVDEDPFAPPPAKSDDDDDAEAAEVDDGLDDIENREKIKVYIEALKVVADERDVIERHLNEGADLAVLLEAKAVEAGKPYDKRAPERLEKALETVIPTRWADYENVDPHKERLAKKLFCELWPEADTLKLLVVASKTGDANVASPLKRVAKYAGVDPKLFNDEVKVSLAELENRIRERVERTVRQAHALFVTATAGGDSSGSAGGGLLVASPGENEPRKSLKIIISGNSSNLPSVRRMFTEVFEPDEKDMIWNKDQLKTAVCQGACEEYLLRKVFGSDGLIRYRSQDFLDRLPYAIGLYNKNLQLVGFKDGFCSIFDRGAQEGADVVIEEGANFLIHSDLKDLALYADYGDGTGAVYLGRFDFKGEPISKSESTSGSEDKFAIDFKLKANREVAATLLSTGAQYGFIRAEEKLSDDVNPFAGVH